MKQIKNYEVVIFIHFAFFVHQEIESNEDFNIVADSLTKLMGRRVSEVNYLGSACCSLTFVKTVYEDEFDILMDWNVKLVTAKEVMKTIA